MLSADAPSQQVAVIGGGISGLATAYQIQALARQGHLPVRFQLFESSPRLGGKITTEQENGFVIEGGPDSFLLQKPWAAELAQVLGLEPELIGANPNQKKLYVVNHRKLTPMPEGVMLIVPTRFMPFVTSPLISWPGKLRMGMDLVIPRRKDDGDESLASFIRRRLGQEALDKLAEPLMSGIHVSDPERQSLLGTFPRFRALEKQHGSLIAGMLAQSRATQNRNGNKPAGQTGTSWRSSAFVTLRGGMGQLIQALEQALVAGELHRGCRVTSIQTGSAGFQITTQGGDTFQADALVLATPSYISSELVSAFAPELSHALATIRYVSTATASLAFPASEVSQRLDGVGFIVPRRENHGISACTVSSTKFSHRAPEGNVLLRCFLGGPGREDILAKSDAEIIAVVRSELSALLGITANPRLARIYRWERGNAQYDVGHLDRVQGLRTLSQAIPGLFLAGSAYEGVGVPDCIHQGQEVARQAIAYLQEKIPSQAIAQED